MLQVKKNKEGRRRKVGLKKIKKNAIRTNEFHINQGIIFSLCHIKTLQSFGKWFCKCPKC